MPKSALCLKHNMDLSNPNIQTNEGHPCERQEAAAQYAHTLLSCQNMAFTSPACILVALDTGRLSTRHAGTNYQLLVHENC